MGSRAETNFALRNRRTGELRKSEILGSLGILAGAAAFAAAFVSASDRQAERVEIPAQLAGTFEFTDDSDINASLTGLLREFRGRALSAGSQTGFADILQLRDEELSKGNCPAGRMEWYMSTQVVINPPLHCAKPQSGVQGSRGR